jgi:hypothetical protein
MAEAGPKAPHVGLGVLGLALGVAPIVAPRAAARAAGLSTRPGVQGLLGAIGVRELVVSAGSLATRVAQDAMDVPLASLTTATKTGGDRARMARVTAFLVALTAVDVAAAIRASRSDGRGDTRRRRGPMVFTAAVTIRRDESEIRSRLHEADPPLSTDEVTVTFAPAPGARGSEVRAVLEKGSGGPVGKVVGAVTGTDPGRQLSDAMRRFKQLVETGEVVRSEGSPEGPSAPRARKQRVAEPIGTES